MRLDMYPKELTNLYMKQRQLSINLHKTIALIVQAFFYQTFKVKKIKNIIFKA